MTTEEKLQHFYDAAIKEARDNAERLLEEHKKELDNLLEDHKKAKDREIATALKAETDQASREINKTLSSQLLDIKREGKKCQDRYKEKLFQEVMTLLEEFKNTESYDDYLKRKIQEALDFAREDPVTVYLSPEDSAKLPAMSKEFEVDLRIAEHSFLGGVQAEIPEKNILIDSSFLEAFNNEKANFTFDGGLTYE